MMIILVVVRIKQQIWQSWIKWSSYVVLGGLWVGDLQRLVGREAPGATAAAAARTVRVAGGVHAPPPLPPRPPHPPPRRRRATLLLERSPAPLLAHHWHPRPLTQLEASRAPHAPSLLDNKERYFIYVSESQVVNITFMIFRNRQIHFVRNIGTFTISVCFH